MANENSNFIFFMYFENHKHKIEYSNLKKIKSDSNVF